MDGNVGLRGAVSQCLTGFHVSRGSVPDIGWLQQPKVILEEPKIMAVKGVWKQHLQAFHTFYGLCAEKKSVTVGIQCSRSTILSKMRSVVFLLYHPIWT